MTTAAKPAVIVDHEDHCVAVTQGRYGETAYKRISIRNGSGPNSVYVSQGTAPDEIYASFTMSDEFLLVKAGI